MVLTLHLCPFLCHTPVALLAKVCSSRIQACIHLPSARGRSQPYWKTVARRLQVCGSGQGKLKVWGRISCWLGQEVTCCSGLQSSLRPSLLEERTEWEMRDKGSRRGWGIGVANCLQSKSDYTHITAQKTGDWDLKNIVLDSSPFLGDLIKRYQHLSQRWVNSFFIRSQIEKLLDFVGYFCFLVRRGTWWT